MEKSCHERRWVETCWWRAEFKDPTSTRTSHSERWTSGRWSLQPDVTRDVRKTTSGLFPKGGSLVRLLPSQILITVIQDDPISVGSSASIKVNDFSRSITLKWVSLIYLCLFFYACNCQYSVESLQDYTPIHLVDNAICFCFFLT